MQHQQMMRQLQMQLKQQEVQNQQQQLQAQTHAPQQTQHAKQPTQQAPPAEPQQPAPSHEKPTLKIPDYHQDLDKGVRQISPCNVEDMGIFTPLEESQEKTTAAATTAGVSISSPTSRTPKK
jgi:hypothetical protein